MAQPPSSFEIKPWMWVLAALAGVFLLTGWDPIGGKLEEIFGAGTARWTLNIFLVGIIIYFMFFKKDKKG